jgi:hypothetical protein
MQLPPDALILIVHPKVEMQNVGEDEVRRLCDAALPRLVPFRGQFVHAVVALLDWDHRLPSRALTLRLHVLYDAAARERFDQAFQRRFGEIRDRNVYPEFDVPDLAGLPADENYDADLTPALEVESIRLTSPWRREVSDADAEKAIEAVRISPEYADAQAREPDRPAHLGELEAVAWTPPCESGQERWTLDVWWLTAFDGRIGRGYSFLVELDPAVRILGAREFNIRAA